LWKLPNPVYLALKRERLMSCCQPNRMGTAVTDEAGTSTPLVQTGLWPDLLVITERCFSP